MAKKTQGDRFPLLVYRRWSKMLCIPSLLIVIAGVVGWWFASQSEEFEGPAWFLLIIAAIGLLIFVYSLMVRFNAYVQCTSKYLKICTPLMPLNVSYARIVQVRPNEFHQQFTIAELSRSARRLVEPYTGQTVIVVELKGYPMSERTLRMWFSRFMFAKEDIGFVLIVDDWMSLSRQINDYMDRRVSRRQDKHGRQGEYRSHVQDILRR